MVPLFPFTTGRRHKPSDLDDFLAPFGVHWGKGQHVLEAKGSADPPQGKEGLPPVMLHLHSDPSNGRTVTATREVILHRREDDSIKKEMQPK